MQLPGYSQLEKFAQGGMATLYKGYQTSLNRPVVVKLLSAQSFWDKTSKMLFEQESLVIAKLNHPNIVHIIDRGQSERGRPFFVMEYIEGKNLAELLQNGKLTVKNKINIIMQVTKGLAFAHKNNVIHRDIKPANILVTPQGHVQILDFGIAWITNAKHDPESSVLGTPDYMSPEQFSSPFDVSYLSDIYSLGVVMYELFMKSLPTEHLENVAASMEFVPKPIALLVEQCLEMRPELRPQTMDEVRVRLLKGLKGAHISKDQLQQASKDIGKSIDKFVLLDVIKNNQFGAVYLSEDKTNKKLMIIKKRTQSKAGYDESRILQRIQHQNIVRILGASKNTNAFIVVMKHLSGGSLQDRLLRPFKSADFFKIALQICQAMEAAHQHKITHNDLRPSNILFDEKNQIKVTDFGFEEHYLEDDETKNWYQAPPHFGSEIVGDIYSAGAIFYHMLTAEPLVLKNKKIVANSVFLNLSEPEQNFIKSLVEKDAPNRHVSFTAIIKHIHEVIRYKRWLPYVRLAKQMLFYFVLINVALAILAFFKPEFFSLVIEQAQHLWSLLKETLNKSIIFI